MFVFGENAFAEGVGEQLQAYPLPDAWYVVLIPSGACATAQIFAHPELTRNTISLTIRALPMAQNFIAQAVMICSRWYAICTRKWPSTLLGWDSLRRRG